jgi:UDP-GlcNAc:undecaprenyl-phosphate GlcNAc-1-phosphate transferase
MWLAAVQIAPVIWLAVIAFGGSFGLSAVLTAVVRGVARRRGLVDLPGAHKRHTHPVSLGGGIAIMAAISLPLICAMVVAGVGIESLVPSHLHEHVAGFREKIPALSAIIGGAVVLHVLGLIDDRRALGPAIKFAVQFAVAGLVVIVFDLRAGHALGAIPSYVLSILWIVLITNAFNFLDNMDGLSAGVALIAAGIFAATSFKAGQIFVPALSLIVAGAAAGFLLFNFAPASIFMGDAGSLVLGFYLAILTMITTYYDERLNLEPFGLLVPLFVLAVPLYDVASVCWHRRKARVSIFRGDQRHFSHRLVRRGLTPRAAVLTIYLATLATGLPATLLPRADWGTALVIAAQCGCTVLIIAVLEHAGLRDDEAIGNG